MKKKIIIPVVIILVLLATTATVLRIGLIYVDHQKAGLKISSEAFPGKEPAPCDFEVISDRARSIGVDVDLTMTKGSVAVKLVDPQGKVVWSSTVKEGEHLKKSMNFSAVKGKWKFLTYDKGTPDGEYLVSFKQKYL